MPIVLPMMVVYETSRQFIRTVPDLCMDEDNPEDIDTEAEDHIYDEACLLCTRLPLAKTLYDLRTQDALAGCVED